MFQSTHPRRVWRGFNTLTPPIVMFQSTHPRRVWLFSPFLITCYLCGFNPHTHAGCDQGTVPFDREIKVSIHTPTQGVTLTSSGTWSYQSMFQSTHPRRVWQYGVCWSSYFCSSFNPHTHAGCDVNSLDGLGNYSERFNPHTHAGCDPKKHPCAWGPLVSIHTPTQGVTSHWI